MKKEQEILTMKPGVDLNAEVAREVMGHIVVKDDCLGYLERFKDKNGDSVWDGLRLYSEDMSIAESVVDKMIREGNEKVSKTAFFAPPLTTVFNPPGDD